MASCKSEKDFRDRRRSVSIALCAVLLVFVFGAIYVPGAGHGFVKDDVGWVARSELRTLGDVRGLLDAPTGFFWPLVSLSFGANRWLCGLDPKCYGRTNIALAIACAASIVVLGCALSLPVEFALVASAIWPFNWHGINMSVLWISGRTALILVLLAVLAATAFTQAAFGWPLSSRSAPC